MNHNPFDLPADHFPRALIMNVAGTVRGRLLRGGAVRRCCPVCVAVTAYRFNDCPFQVLRADASDRTRLLLPTLQQRLTHVVSVAAALAGGVAWRHPVAP